MVEVEERWRFFLHILQLFLIRNYWEKNNTIRPAILQFTVLNVDESSRLNVRLYRFVIFFILRLEIVGKRPLWHSNWSIITLPESVADSQVDIIWMVENRNAVLLVLGQEVEMSSTRSLVNIIGLPNSIFQLHHYVPHHQSQRNIRFHLHLVPHPHKYLAIFYLISAQFLSHQSYVYHVSLSVNMVLSCCWFVLVFISATKSGL